MPIKGVVGFELFNESDMGLTEFAQKINYQRALQGELARTIMDLDEIDTARVHLAIPDRAIFRNDKAVPKAAISIHAKPGKVVTSASVEGIQRLVASAVNELALSDVSILDESGRLISASPNFDEFSVPEIAEKQAVEQYYRARIASALDSVLPGRRIKVSVRAANMSADNADIIDNVTGNISADNGADTASPSDEERNFRLFVVLTTPTVVGEEDQQLIRQTTEDAIGFSSIIGDRINFSTAMATMDESNRSSETRGSASTPFEAATSDPVFNSSTVWSIFYWTGLAALALLIFGVAVRSFRNRDDHLSAEDQDLFAERLKAKLAENG